jgi:hypothetical protein
LTVNDGLDEGKAGIRERNNYVMKDGAKRTMGMKNPSERDDVKLKTCGNDENHGRKYISP